MLGNLYPYHFLSLNIFKFSGGHTAMTKADKSTAPWVFKKSNHDHQNVLNLEIFY